MITEQQLKEYIDANGEEIWVQIEYKNVRKGMYEVSNYGNIRRIDNKREMKKVLRSGYYSVKLCISDNGSKHFLVHRLVAHAFVKGQSFENNIVNHLDGNKLNNVWSNLEWCDIRHNVIHAFSIGLNKNKGSASRLANITNPIAEKICELIIENNGDIFKVLQILSRDNIPCSYETIRAIKEKKSWCWLSDKYFAKDVYKKQRMLTECDVTKICQTLIKYKGDTSMVYNELKDTVQNLKPSYISEIKNKKTYKDISDSYFGYETFIDSDKIPTEQLDLVRELLITNVMKGSPSKVYDSLNHEKYYKLTLAVIKMISAGSHDSYNRSDIYDLNEYYSDKNNCKYRPISETLLNKLLASYSSGNSDITDSAYDELIEDLIRVHGEDKRPYLRQKQPGVINGLVCSLGKVYGVREPMREGQDTYEKWFYRKGINPNAKIIIQPKFDGASVAVDKNGRFFTRGDYQNGESVNVTDLFKNHNISKLMRESVDGVKFEAIMSHENFYSAGIDELEGYLKPLDVVNAIIHSRNDKVSEYITLIPLRESVGGKEYVCSDLQKLSIVTTTADDFDTIQQFIVDKLNDGATVEYGGRHYSIDGVVVSVLGPDNQTQEEIAIKILNDINVTKLIDVKFQFGKTGKITPVAIVEPVKFCDGNRTVDHITLSTLDRVNEMSLRKGDTVRVMYNIVPYLLDTKHDGTQNIELPTHCPKCGAPFEYTTLKTVRCTNPICQGRKLGSIIRYCEKMKMMGVGESTLNTLFDNGLIKEIDDLYTLTSEDIQKLPGFKQTSADNIIKSIHNSSKHVPVCRWLGALPFLDVDSKKWELLLTTLIGNDELRKSNLIIHIFTEAPDEFENLLVQKSVRGIGTATIKSMYEGFISNKDMIQRLIKHISFKSTTDVSTKGKVCLTGTRDATVIDYLTKKGYSVSDTLTKDTVLVVRPDPMFESAKTKRAKELGIKIITINEALGL